MRSSAPTARNESDRARELEVREVVEEELGEADPEEPEAGEPDGPRAADEAEGEEAEPDRAPDCADGGVASLEVRLDRRLRDELGELENTERERVEAQDPGGAERDRAVRRLPRPEGAEEAVERDRLAPRELRALGGQLVPCAEAERDRREHDENEARDAVPRVLGGDDEVARRRFEDERVPGADEQEERGGRLEADLARGEREHESAAEASVSARTSQTPSSRRNSAPRRSSAAMAQWSVDRSRRRGTRKTDAR